MYKSTRPDHIKNISIHLIVSDARELTDDESPLTCTRSYDDIKDMSL